MAYIPIIKNITWIDLSDEHKHLRETLEHDIDAACCKNESCQPIMLQGAFGIGKTHTLNYVFHYAWEKLHVPTFYLPLSTIVDKVREYLSTTGNERIQNDELIVVIQNIIDSQIATLKQSLGNNNEPVDIYFPLFRAETTLKDYLADFSPVDLETENEGKTLFPVFSNEIISQGIESGNKPLLLVDEFESKFYELKKLIESSGGGVLRQLFDELVETRPFFLIIGNGPASGYEVAKERGDGANNDSETAANRRLKTLQIPFPTVSLLKREFLIDKPNGYVNFIWWMSRCRPGHIQKLADAINYDSFAKLNFSEFVSKDIFSQPIDEGGESVTYLKTDFFNHIDPHLHPILAKLLLHFEPNNIDLTDNVKDALKNNGSVTNRVGNLSFLE